MHATCSYPSTIKRHLSINYCSPCLKSQILTPFLLRRLKTDVEFKIPPKKEILVYAPLTPAQERYYKTILDRTILEMIEAESKKELSKRREREKEEKREERKELSKRREEEREKKEEEEEETPLSLLPSVCEGGSYGDGGGGGSDCGGGGDSCDGDGEGGRRKVEGGSEGGDGESGGGGRHGEESEKKAHVSVAECGSDDGDGDGDGGRRKGGGVSVGVGGKESGERAHVTTPAGVLVSGEGGGEDGDGVMGDGARGGSGEGGDGVMGDGARGGSGNDSSSTGERDAGSVCSEGRETDPLASSSSSGSAWGLRRSSRTRSTE